MNIRTAAAALAASALLLPSAALAGNGHGKGAEKHVKKDKSAKTHGKKGPKTVQFVFKGTFTAPGTVTVTSGNAHVRKGGFVGQAVTFDFSSAKLVVDDVNGDGVKDIADVADGDKVKVQARVAKGTKFVAPEPVVTDPVVAEGETAPAEGESAAIVARKLIDKTAGDAPESDEQPEAGETPEGGDPEGGDDAAVAQSAS
jgi:hypothetical protein